MKLIKGLKDRSWKVRFNSAMEIGKIAEKRGGCSKAVPALIEVLKDESKWVREAAVEAIKKAVNRGNCFSAVPALIDILKKDESEWVRLTAVRTLGEISRIIVSSLKTSLRDDECYDVRLEAARVFRVLEVIIK